METGNATILQQEKVNSFTHGAGLLFGIIGIPYLVYTAYQHCTLPVIIATGIYGLSFLMVFAFSTLYHGFQQPVLKRIFKILDHISIYFLIAGTYTPLILLYVNNTFGLSILIIQWVLTIMGGILKIFFTGRFEIVSTITYLLMGMLLVSGGQKFFAAMPPVVIKLVISGGILYCAGVIFYVWSKPRFNHGVWHLFVLSAAVCHYVAIFKSVNT